MFANTAKSSVCDVSCFIDLKKKQMNFIIIIKLAKRLEFNYSNH